MLKRLAIFACLIPALAAAAQTVQPILQPHATYVDAAGDPCVGCFLYSYAAGTTTPLNTYTDSTGGTPNTNPVVLGTDGGAAIWLGASSYKFILKDTGGTPIWTVDNVSGVGKSLSLYVPLAGGTMTGLLTNTVGFVGTTNGVVSAAQFSGADIGAKVNAALAATSVTGALVGYGKITIPPGNYTFSTTISLVNYPDIILDCQGANLTYTGTTVAFDALQPAPGSSANATGGIENCNTFAPASPANDVIVYRFGNLLNYLFKHNSAWSFDASGDVGLLVVNTQYFTEDSIITDNQMREVTVGYEFQKNCGGGGCTESVEYTYFKNNYWDSPVVTVSGAAGLLLTGGVRLQNSVVELHANVNGPSGGTVVKLATSGDQILRDQIAIQAEVDGPTVTQVCVANSGGFYANGTLQCDGMSNTGSSVVVFGSDDGWIGNEALATRAINVVNGAVTGSSSNMLPDSENTLHAYWQSPIGDAKIGTSLLNTGHTDYGNWNTGSTQTCTSGVINSQPFTLPAGTYTISAAFYQGGGVTGCASAFANVAIYAGASNIANMFGSKDPNGPISFTLNTPTTIFWEFTYGNWTFPNGAYLIWNAPQLEQGTAITAYKQSLWGSGSPGSVPFTYTMQGSSGGSTWLKLGTWVTQGGNLAQGDTLKVSLLGGYGQVSGQSSQGEGDILIRAGNGSAAPNLAGASMMTSGSVGGSNLGTQAYDGLKVVATGGSTSIANKSWDIYIHQTVAFSGGYYQITVNPSDTWTDSDTLTSDPGAGSSSILVGTVNVAATTTGGVADGCATWATGILNSTGSACSGGGGVASINTVTGAFTFTGSGVSCTSTTCTFSGTGAGMNFNGLTSGTNTAAAMLVGTGASLGTTGSGTIAATSLSANLPVGNLNSGTSASSSTYWRGDGTWATPAGTGTVTAFSAGNLSPLFTSSVATSTTTPALTFTLSNAAADTVFGNPTGGSAAPVFTSNPVLTSILATIFYTNVEFNNNTCTTAKTITPVNGNKQKVTLTNGSTCALTFTQPSSGTATVQLKVIQSAVSSFNGGISGCKWPGGVVPTITQTTGAVDMVSVYLDGTNAYCQIAQAFN
jgi:hypothetical protein